MIPSEKGIDIFVSYAHEDQGVAKKLVQFLEKRGWSVWWDSDLTAGAVFDKTIEAKLAGARCVIVVWSRASIKSDFVFGEASLAYGRGVAVPVLVGIDVTEVALGFRRVQCVALAASDGYIRLQRALESKLQEAPPPPPPPRRLGYWLAGVVLLLSVIVTLLFIQPSYRERFLSLRPGGHPGRSIASEGMIGVTLWRLRPSTDRDPPHTRMLQEPPPDKPEVRKEEWTPVRARTDSELPERSKVRLGIESSRDGFVYVIDREAYADKTTGPPQLIFPTLHTLGRGNRIVRGLRLELPSPGADVIYWDLKSNQQSYTGELLTVIISLRSVPELEGALGPRTLPDSLVSAWEREWGAGAHMVFNGPGDALTTPAEAQARADYSHLLTSGDAAPTTIYALPNAGGGPMLVKFPIRVISKAVI